jgi:hypothetical protein
MFRRFQQQLEEEFAKLGAEQLTKGENHTEQASKQLKGAIKQATEQTKYQPKPDRRDYSTMSVVGH